MTCKTQARFNRHILAVKRLTVISVENCVFLHLRSRMSHLSLIQMRNARVQMLKDIVFRPFLRVCASAHASFGILGRSHFVSKTQTVGKSRLLANRCWFHQFLCGYELVRHVVRQESCFKWDQHKPVEPRVRVSVQYVLKKNTAFSSGPAIGHGC